MLNLKDHLIDPTSALTQVVATVAALIGTGVLVELTWNDRPKMISLAIYGTSIVFLFAISALHHSLKLSERKRLHLNRLDHMAIFVLIAGTYTPIAYNLFPINWRWPVLIMVWLLAIVGVLKKATSTQLHGSLTVPLFIVVAWVGVVPGLIAFHEQRVVPLEGLLWLFLGGLLYMFGSAIYHWKWPDPWPGIFGHHDIWHLFVIAASVCFYLFMFWYVVPPIPS